MQLPEHISPEIAGKVRRFFTERASGQIVLHVTKGVVRGCEINESMPNDLVEQARASKNRAGGW